MEKYGSIDQFTEEELRERLAKIEKDKEPELPTDRPGVMYNAKQIPGHFNKLITEAEQIIDSIMDGTFHPDNDNEYYMYECAMECIYGAHIWEWINKHVK